MCGFVGSVNLNKKFNSNVEFELLKKMNNTLSKRGPDEEGYYINNHVCMAHKRLIVIDPKGRQTTNDRKIFIWRLCYCL